LRTRRLFAQIGVPFPFVGFALSFISEQVSLIGGTLTLVSPAFAYIDFLLAPLNRAFTILLLLLPAPHNPAPLIHHISPSIVITLSPAPTGEEEKWPNDHNLARAMSMAIEKSLLVANKKPAILSGISGGSAGFHLISIGKE
jgi:hypothetical protein